MNPIVDHIGLAILGRPLVNRQAINYDGEILEYDNAICYLYEYSQSPASK